MVICASNTVIGAPKMIADAASMIVCGRTMVLCSPKMIADVAGIIVSVVEKIELLTSFIDEGMEIILSLSSTMTDDVEIILKETESIVTMVLSKGKTGGKEAAKQVTDVKPPACLVWFVVFPLMPSKRA